MYRRLTARFVRARFAELSRGEYGSVLERFADDALFEYAGAHLLAGTFRTRAEIERWFARTWSMFAIEFEIHDVLVCGPPWRTSVTTRFTATMTTRDGRVFRNRGRQYARVRWGRVIEDRIDPDAQVVAAAVAHGRALASRRDG